MFRITAIVFLISGVLIGVWYLYYGGYFSGAFLNPDVERAREIHPFFTGLVVPLLTLGSTLLVFENLQNTTKQNFSNNFLKLIDQHHKLVDNINSTIEGISAEDKPSKARAFFDDLAWRIATDYRFLPKATADIENNLAPNENINVLEKVGKEKLVHIYDYYFHIYQSDLGHYFRNLYNIIRYAEDAASKSVQIQHVKMLRAQLSNYEILLIAYNGMHAYGTKFHRLIEKFELLKNLNLEERLPTDRLKRIVDIKILEENYPHLKNLMIKNNT
jgi:Putative phage abortive infection protein